MPDERFFNRSINQAAGATESLSADGTVSEGTTQVNVDASAGAVTVTLPAASVGGCITVVGTDISNPITVAAGAGDSLTGLSAIDGTNRALIYCSDGGTGWYSIPTA